jgi:hypothetical protein
MELASQVVGVLMDRLVALQPAETASSASK